ncbi:MAG: glycosyltransferase family 9 protein [Deferribacteraceae bacterium]|jgi:heptosyltransferase-2|nr:glycosyltransferase family 9 protein [Deferribacteraceae bacterium]
MLNNKKSRILIIKIGALGDIVTASTMIGTIRSKEPDAHITWLCGKDLSPLVRLIDGIDEILTVNRKLISGNVLQKIILTLTVWKLLFFKKYDLCIIGQLGIKYKLLPIFSRCREVRMFGGRYGPLSGRYRGDEYFRLASGSDNYFSEHAPLAKISIPSEKNNTVMLFPAGSYDIPLYDGLRRWPVEKYVSLAKRLIERGFRVGLIGEPRDKWAEKYFDGLEVTSFIGKTTIHELMSLLAGSLALITHDGGPMHIAYLLDIPVIAMFGPTLHKDFLIETKKAMAISSHPPCSPCYDGKNYARCKSNICLQNISVEQVLHKFDKLITLH